MFIGPGPDHEIWSNMFVVKNIFVFERPIVVIAWTLQIFFCPGLHFWEGDFTDKKGIKILNLNSSRGHKSLLPPRTPNPHLTPGTQRDPAASILRKILIWKKLRVWIPPKRVDLSVESTNGFFSFSERNYSFARLFYDCKLQLSIHCAVHRAKQITK